MSGFNQLLQSSKQSLILRGEFRRLGGSERSYERPSFGEADCVGWRKITGLEIGSDVFCSAEGRCCVRAMLWKRSVVIVYFKYIFYFTEALKQKLK